MIWALLGAVCIGISLGLLGSGGSILTVPVLVYVLKHHEKSAMAESLAIVGAIALIGAVQYALKKMIDWRSVLYFGVPGMAGSYGGAWLAHFIPGAVLLGIFALFMLAAAFMMLRPVKLDSEAADGRPRAFWKIAIDGLLVGALTGLVGAGGGFLIVPALVLLGRLNMHLAIGTSLFIIAMKSATGFIKYIDVVQKENLQIDWDVIGLFIIAGAIGSFAGNRIARLVNQATLRRFFGVFLIVMGIYILVSQTVKLSSQAPQTSQPHQTPQSPGTSVPGAT